MDALADVGVLLGVVDEGDEPSGSLFIGKSREVIGMDFLQRLVHGRGRHVGNSLRGGAKANKVGYW